jgi:tRNA threonylcarbamoyladenosine biosynthesis protein TsaE
MERHLPDAESTEQLGARLGATCLPGVMIYLKGDLGAGKTTLVRGMLRQMGYTGRVKSPTYTLVEEYRLAERRLFHFDLYRIADPDELEYIGLDEMCRGDAICLVEWPEMGSGRLPRADLVIELAHNPGSGRDIRLTGISAAGRRIVDSL